MVAMHKQSEMYFYAVATCSGCFMNAIAEQALSQMHTRLGDLRKQINVLLLEHTYPEARIDS